MRTHRPNIGGFARAVNRGWRHQSGSAQPPWYTLRLRGLCALVVLLMVYLDNAASTPPLPPVLQAWVEASSAHVANPSSAHALGAAAARALQDARTEAARALGVAAQELTFTSGGTEANALAVLGAARAKKQKHVVATGIEHASVRANVMRLAAEGYAIDWVEPGADGVVRAADVLRQVSADTGVVAMVLVNNELGTVQPVEEVARALAELPRPPHLHVDAVQAAAWMPLPCHARGIGSMALSGHKLHAPKGTGALWLRRGARVRALWDGGGQENGVRSGTENVAGAVAFARACAACASDRATTSARVRDLRDTFEANVLDQVPDAALTVPATTPRAPHISSVRLRGLPAEPLLHALEARGVFASAGSACAANKPERSHVLTAIGVADADAVLRFSLSRLTTTPDIQAAVAALCEAAREISSVSNLLAFRKRR